MDSGSGGCVRGAIRGLRWFVLPSSKCRARVVVKYIAASGIMNVCENGLSS